MSLHQAHKKIMANIKGKCKEILEKIGVKPGQVVVDFGCGKGNYAIPVAEIIGTKGKIYALDESKSKLSELSRRSKSSELENIQIINTDGKLNFNLKDNSVDVVLLYDIFWYFSLTDPDLPKLLKEVYRILKKNSLVSVYPEHIDIEKLKEKIEDNGFYLQKRFTGNIVHEDNIEKGQILNFRK